MRHLFTVLSVLLLSLSLFGQQWIDKKYTYDSLLNLTYGSDIGFDGQMDSLKLDLYLPNCDDPSHLSKRPLILVIHGGAFIAGDKAEASIQYTCRQFAKRGYVAASINYRLGFVADEQLWNCNYPNYSCIFATDSSEWYRAYYRGVQDAKGALRYLLNRADTYRIDPSNVFLTGESAGSFISLGAALLDVNSERPIQTFALSNTPVPNANTANCVYNVGANLNAQGITRPDLGGIAGTIEPSTVPYTIKGVGNIFGGMFSNLMAQQAPGTTKPSIFSYHQPCDIVVSIDSAKIFWGLTWCMTNGYGCFGIANTPKSYGSRTISDWNTTQNLGYTIHNEFTTTTFPYSFVFGQASCTDQASNPCHAYDNTILREGNMAQFFADLVSTNPICDTAALELDELDSHFSIHPNPTSGTITIDFEKWDSGMQVNVYSCTGQLVQSKYINDVTTKMEINEKDGIYFIEVISDFGRSTKRVQLLRN